MHPAPVSGLHPKLVLTLCERDLVRDILKPGHKPSGEGAGGSGMHTHSHVL